MGSMSDLSLLLESHNGVPIIAVRGDVDIASSPRLAQSIAVAERDSPSALKLDLGGVTFIDCGGLRVLLQTSERARAARRQLVMVGVSPAARTLFRLTGTDFLADKQGFVSAPEPVR